MFAAFAVLLVVLASIAPLSAEEKKDWEPDPPMPDEWDWVQLVSGEWLKGEIVAMYDGTMEFDSDELDMLELDFGDIIQIRSGGIMRVMFLGQITATGKLLVEGDKVRILGDEEQVFDRADVVTVAAGEPKESNYWSSKVSLGINIRSGNTNQKDANLSARFQRRTVKNRINIDYLGNYSLVETALDPTDPNSPTSEEPTANNHRASTSWDKFITDRFYVKPIFGEYFRDPFQNIGSRVTLGVGAGYDIIDTSKTDLTVSGGPAYQSTSFDSVVPPENDSETTPAFVLATAFDKELTGWMDFVWLYSFQIVNEESGSYNHHMETRFETELTSMLDFDISWVWDRIKDPRANADGIVPKSDDTRFIVALGFDW